MHDATKCWYSPNVNFVLNSYPRQHLSQHFPDFWSISRHFLGSCQSPGYFQVSQLSGHGIMTETVHCFPLYSTQQCSCTATWDEPRDATKYETCAEMTRVQAGEILDDTSYLHRKRVHMKHVKLRRRHTEMEVWGSDSHAYNNEINKHMHMSIKSRKLLQINQWLTTHWPTVDR